jgi:SpoVK/Ycf46/Vps4 family AAA+-type ATPase
VGASTNHAAVRVQAIAAEASARIISITAATIVGAYLGESERRLREAFEGAQAASRRGERCFIFLDEVDALCPHRGSVNGHEGRIVAQLLTLLDGASKGTKGPLVR